MDLILVFLHLIISKCVCVWNLVLFHKLNFNFLHLGVVMVHTFLMF